jgi:hypothetical protein
MALDRDEAVRHCLTAAGQTRGLPERNDLTTRAARLTWEDR